MNILVITPYFPTFDIFRERSEDPRTKFLYDYLAEWSKLGHNILVFHTIPKYPEIFTWITRIIEILPISNRFQLRRFKQKKATLQYANYVSSGIHIIRIPVPKYIPHRDYLQNHMRKLKLQIDSELQSISWAPDMVLSDFLCPSLSAACHVKDYTTAHIYQIFHQSDLRYLRSKKAIMLELLNETSGVLYRSYSMKQLIERYGCNAQNYSYMFSGIPANIRLGTCRRVVVKYLYVGTLRYSKNLHKIIKAFAISSIDDSCRLEIIGTGPDENKLKQLPRTLGIETRVHFIGKVTREKVFEIMRSSDCLIMVSKETFGMVYIEAMSQGCVVVAAKGQGIDGIVVDGENGFLVPLNDMNQLVETINKISCMNENDLFRITKNAIATASKMKDDVLAYNLLEWLKEYKDPGR
jgi:glycosyltransferase involved in cell wall biosynthesis